MVTKKKEQATKKPIATDEIEINFLHGLIVIGQGEMALN